MTAPPPIRLRLLGRFSVVAEGDPPVTLKISSKKGIALLAYLALHPEHSVSREKLATLLWGDRPDRQARLNLRQVILSLRKTFAETELIALDRDTVGLRMERLSVDALQFQELSRSSEPGDLARAAALYGGPLLSEMDIEPEDFAAWLRNARERFEAEAARVLESCADQNDAANQGSLAIDAAERLVALDPLREDWQRRLLRIYARYRSAEAALAHARTLTALLKKELDVEAEPSTLQLIDEIRRGAVEPVRTQPILVRLAQANADVDSDNNAPHDLPLPPGALETKAPRSAPLWRTRVGAFWFLTSLCVLLAGALWLGNPGLASLHAGLSPAEVVSIANAPLSLAPVVVLPFEAADKGDGAIAELVSDDVIDELRRVPNLRVISRLTSHQYWQTSRDIVDVGRRLKVRYAVHGSVKSEEGKWRINVELIDVTSRLQIWSDRFDQSSSDSAEAATMIASELGQGLQVAVLNDQAERSNNLPSSETGVEALTAKGWKLLVSDTSAEELARAEADFSEALRRDPDHVGAMLGLAAHHLISLGLLVIPQQEPYLGEAETLLARVLERRPGSSPAHYYLGLAEMFRGDLGAALKSLQKSVELNPSFAPGYAMMGRVMTLLGQNEGALQSIQHARSLSPKDPALPLWDLGTGLAELELGHDQAAIEWISHGVVANPENPFAQISLAAAYALAGDQANADLHVERFRQLTPNFTNEQRLNYFPDHWPDHPQRFMTSAR